MKWLNNLKMVAENQKPQICPFCQSNNVDYAYEIVDEESMMGHGSIWCEDCHNAYHISRIKINGEMKLGQIPKNLKY